MDATLKTQPRYKREVMAGGWFPLNFQQGDIFKNIYVKW
jgi:hypothetical protein